MLPSQDSTWLRASFQIVATDRSEASTLSSSALAAFLLRASSGMRSFGRSQPLNRSLRAPGAVVSIDFAQATQDVDVATASLRAT